MSLFFNRKLPEKHDEKCLNHSLMSFFYRNLPEKHEYKFCYHSLISIFYRKILENKMKNSFFIHWCPCFTERFRKTSTRPSTSGSRCTPPASCGWPSFPSSSGPTTTTREASSSRAHTIHTEYFWNTFKQRIKPSISFIYVKNSRKYPPVRKWGIQRKLRLVDFSWCRNEIKLSNWRNISIIFLGALWS